MWIVIKRSWAGPLFEPWGPFVYSSHLFAWYLPCHQRVSDFQFTRRGFHTLTKFDDAVSRRVNCWQQHKSRTLWAGIGWMHTAKHGPCSFIVICVYRVNHVLAFHTGTGFFQPRFSFEPNWRNHIFPCPNVCLCIAFFFFATKWFFRVFLINSTVWQLCFAGNKIYVVK